MSHVLAEYSYGLYSYALYSYGTCCSISWRNSSPVSSVSAAEGSNDTTSAHCTNTWAKLYHTYTSAHCTSTWAQLPYIHVRTLHQHLSHSCHTYASAHCTNTWAHSCPSASRRHQRNQGTIIQRRIAQVAELRIGGRVGGFDLMRTDVGCLDEVLPLQTRGIRSPEAKDKSSSRHSAKHLESAPVEAPRNAREFPRSIRQRDHDHSRWTREYEL